MKLVFNGLVDNNNSFFLIENYYNYLLEINKKNLSLMRAVRLVEDEFDKMHYYHGIIKKDNIIVAMPCWGNKICVYHYSNGEKYYIDFKEKYKSQIIVIDSSSINSEIFVYSTNDTSIYAVDTHTLSLKLIGQNSEIKDEFKGFAFHAEINGRIYFSTSNPSNTLIEFCTGTGNFHMHHFDCSDIIHICKAFDSIWIVTIKGEIIRWDKQNAKQLVYKRSELKGAYETVRTKFLYDNKRMYLFGLFRDGSAITIDPFSGKINRVHYKNIYDGYDNYYSSWLDQFYHYGCEYGNGICIQKLDRSYYFSDGFDGSFSKPLCVDISKLPHVSDIDQKQIINEDFYYNLDMVLELLINEKLIVK